MQDGRQYALALILRDYPSELSEFQRQLAMASAVHHPLHAERVSSHAELVDYQGRLRLVSYTPRPMLSLINRRMVRFLLAVLGGAGVVSVPPVLARENSPTSAVGFVPESSGLLTVLPKGRGRVFSDKPGGAVAGKVGRKRIRLHDGDPVQFVDDNSGIGMGEDTFAEVVFNEQRVTVPNQNIILEDRLSRSPDGNWAVFSSFVSCVDFCYASGWLLGANTRIRLAERSFGPDLTVAWRSDGKEVAVGSRGLYLVSLPDGKVTSSSEFTSPTYAPSGRLFVRGNGERDDAVYEWSTEGKPRKVLVVPGNPPVMETDTDPGGPRPVTFARNEALTAEFERNDTIRRRTVAAGDIGRNLDGRSTPRPPTLDQTLKLIEEPTSPPATAATTALEECVRSPAFAHELAVAANTRGYRLFQDGKLDDAIPLFDAAVSLDGKYGMPRFNLARIYALRGNAPESVVYLRMLKVMGKAQRDRLNQARNDSAFEKIANSPEFQALFH